MTQYSISVHFSAPGIFLQPAEVSPEGCRHAHLCQGHQNVEETCGGQPWRVTPFGAHHAAPDKGKMELFDILQLHIFVWE